MSHQIHLFQFFSVRLVYNSRPSEKVGKVQLTHKDLHSLLYKRVGALKKLSSISSLNNYYSKSKTDNEIVPSVSEISVFCPSCSTTLKSNEESSLLDFITQRFPLDIHTKLRLRKDGFTRKEGKKKSFSIHYLIMLLGHFYKLYSLIIRTF